MLFTTSLFEVRRSRLGDVLSLYVYPWQILPELAAHIRTLGAALPTERFKQVGEEVWIAKTATVAGSAEIAGPCIIDEDAAVRTGAFLRGAVMVGRGAVVGNSTELKNALLFDGVQVPHYNYVGDSVLGYKAHLGAGAVTSNVKSDRSLVVSKNGDERLETGLRKCGAMIGDRAEIGCGCVLNPGAVIGAGAQIYPLSSVRGVVPAGYIYKAADNVVKRREHNETVIRN